MEKPETEVDEKPAIAAQETGIALPEGRVLDKDQTKELSSL